MSFQEIYAKCLAYEEAVKHEKTDSLEAIKSEIQAYQNENAGVSLVELVDPESGETLENRLISEGMARSLALLYPDQHHKGKVTDYLRFQTQTFVPVYEALFEKVARSKESESISQASGYHSDIHVMNPRFFSLYDRNTQHVDEEQQESKNTLTQ